MQKDGRLEHDAKNKSRLRKDGDPQKIAITVSVKPETNEKLLAFARKGGRSRAGMAGYIIEQQLKTRPKDPHAG